MKRLITCAILASAVLAYAHGQQLIDGRHRKVFSSSSCSFPYTPTLSGTGPLPLCYTTNIAGLGSITQTGGTLVTSATYALAVMNGVSAQSPESSRVKWITAGANSGPTLLTTSGNGYAWLPNLSHVYIINAGMGGSTLPNACPTASVNDVLKLSISSTTITCTDVTTSTSITNTDTTYAGSTLFTGFIVYNGQPLSNPSSTSP